MPITSRAATTVYPGASAGMGGSFKPSKFTRSLRTRRKAYNKEFKKMSATIERKYGERLTDEQSREIVLAAYEIWMKFVPDLKWPGSVDDLEYPAEV